MSISNNKPSSCSYNQTTNSAAMLLKIAKCLWKIITGIFFCITEKGIKGIRRTINIMPPLFWTFLSKERINFSCRSEKCWNNNKWHKYYTSTKLKSLHNASVIKKGITKYLCRRYRSV